MANLNVDCGGSRCVKKSGEVRVLPLSSMSNQIFCQACFDHEIKWRREENKRLSKHAQYALPRWADLEVYEPDEAKRNRHKRFALYEGGRDKVVEGMEEVSTDNSILQVLSPNRRLSELRVGEGTLAFNAQYRPSERTQYQIVRIK